MSFKMCSLKGNSVPKKLCNILILRLLYLWLLILLRISFEVTSGLSIRSLLSPLDNHASSSKHPTPIFLKSSSLNFYSPSKIKATEKSSQASQVLSDSSASAFLSFDPKDQSNQVPPELLSPITSLYHQAMIITGSKDGGIRLRPVSSGVVTSTASNFKPNWASMLHRTQPAVKTTKRRPIFSSTSTTQASVEEINASPEQLPVSLVSSPETCCSSRRSSTTTDTPSINAINTHINDIDSHDPMIASESSNDSSESEPIVLSSNHRFTVLQRKNVTVVQETIPDTLPKNTPDPWLVTPSSTSSFTEFPKLPVTTKGPTSFFTSRVTTAYPPYTVASTHRPSVSTPTSVMNMLSNRPKVTAVTSNRHKSPDRIESPSMTVLDSSNGSVTIVHQKLIVPYKPGRPRPGVSSIGVLKPGLQGTTRPKPNTTETGEVIPSDDAELTTYYPQGVFRPTTMPPQPWTCAPYCQEEGTSSPFVTHVTSTTQDPFLTLESQHVLQTKRPIHHGFQPATVNAILAPPMPSRPISTPAPIGNTGIFSSLMGVLGVDSTGGLMSRLTLLKTALFTLLVMFLPPLTLAAAVAQLL